MRSRLIIALCVSTALVVGFLPAAEANHNNKGTIKVHDSMDEDPDMRNVPHVSCDFWIEGFKMGDDEGWLAFFAWPPTGNKSEVTPTGDDLDWMADSGEEAGEFHFLKGPYQLDPGHYRVEAYTEDGHPGRDGGHFAKSKTFWVDPCEQNGNGEHPPCPPGVTATAESNGDITLEWDAVEDADGYNVYRAVGEGDFEYVDTVEATMFVDTDTEVGVTYSYTVTALIDGVESQDCEIVEATAIPFFPSLVAGGLALAGSVGAMAAFRRRT